MQFFERLATAVPFAWLKTARRLSTLSWVPCFKASSLSPQIFGCCCTGVIVDAVGHSSMPRLFAAFADLQRSAPKDLQWLLLLACWLSNTAGPLSTAPRPQQHDGSPRRHAAVDKPLNPTLEKGLGPDTDAAHLVCPRGLRNLADLVRRRRWTAALRKPSKSRQVHRATRVHKIVMARPSRRNCTFNMCQLREAVLPNTESLPQDAPDLVLFI